MVGREEQAAEEAAGVPQSLLMPLLIPGPWLPPFGEPETSTGSSVPWPVAGDSRGHGEDPSSRCFTGAKVEQAEDAEPSEDPHRGGDTPLVHGEGAGSFQLPFL